MARSSERWRFAPFIRFFHDAPIAGFSGRETALTNG
jgi:hypothetical protein